MEGIVITGLAKKMQHYMIDNDLEFINITSDYLESSAKLAEAASLAGEDPIKQDMIAFIEARFLQMCARAEGVRLLAAKDYQENREFILAEMTEITKLNLDMAEEITQKLGKLSN